MREAQRLSRSRTQLVATILRHLHQCGTIPADPAGTIPLVANWSPAGLPKSLQPEAVESILGGCDRSTGAGQRDHAILLLPARLGLRGGEAAVLTLGDFDWHAGTVRFGKGQRREPLSLPCEVGEAVADFLRNGRPAACRTRRVSSA